MRITEKKIKFVVLVVFSLLISSCISNSTDKFDIENAIGKENLVDIFICGSGPAGLSAAMHGARTRMKTLVAEGDSPGGQLTRTTFVENYPGRTKVLGGELVADIREQAKSFGAEFLSDTVKNIDFSSWPYKIETEGGMIFHALSVIIATGKSPRSLGVPGEEKYYARGVSHCAICDGPFYKGEDIVVVGGGDAAVEEAIQLAPYARKIIVLVRSNKMRAIPIMRENLTGYPSELKDKHMEKTYVRVTGKDEKIPVKQEHSIAYPNIFIRYNTVITEIVGDGAQVTGVKLLDKKTGEHYQVKVAGVFLAIGSDPATEFLKGGLQLNERGYIAMPGGTQQTSVKGVLVAGDVGERWGRQASIASGSGVQAGIDAYKFLTEEVGLSTKAVNKIKKYYFNKDFVSPGEVLVNFDIKHLENLSDLDREIQRNAKPIVLDFYADYCPSCIQMLPALEEVAKDFHGKIKFFKVEADKAIDIVKKYHVQRIPCLIVLKDGKLVGRYTGGDDVATESDLHDFVQKFVETTE